MRNVFGWSSVRGQKNEQPAGSAPSDTLVSLGDNDLILAGNFRWHACLTLAQTKSSFFITRHTLTTTGSAWVLPWRTRKRTPALCRSSCCIPTADGSLATTADARATRR